MAVDNFLEQRMDAALGYCLGRRGCPTEHLALLRLRMIESLERLRSGSSTMFSGRS
jgi:hypothetical protein